MFRVEEVAVNLAADEEEKKDTGDVGTAGATAVFPTRCSCCPTRDPDESGKDDEGGGEERKDSLRQQLRRALDEAGV